MRNDEWLLCLMFSSAGGQQSEPLKRISTDVLRDEHCYLRMNNRTVLPTEVCAFDEVSRTETPCDVTHMIHLKL